MIENDKEKTILSFFAGVSAYLAIASLIPKEWNFLPRAKNGALLNGFRNGFGSIRNTLSTSVGIVAMLATRSLLKERPVTESENIAAAEKREANTLGQGNYPCSDNDNNNDFHQNRLKNSNAKITENLR